MPRKETNEPRGSLPAIQDAFDLCEREIRTPPELIHDVLHQGSKLSISGATKGYTTWLLDALALAVSYGQPWLGFQTERARVLLIDLELQEAFCQRRLIALQNAMNVYHERGRLDVWNLRGFAVGHQEIIPRIAERIGAGGYGLIILDPIYKLYTAGSNENAAADVALLMNSLERLAVASGAAVAFRAHFSKGSQAGKESIDRVSGSGVFARDPDSILAITAHSEPDCYTLDLTLRNFPPVDPLVVRWNFPLFDRDPTLDPTALKKKSGRPTVYTADDVLAVLKDGMSTTAWRTASGISQKTFQRLRSQRLAAKKVRQDGQKWSQCA